jgi:hypothetical protein
MAGKIDAWKKSFLETLDIADPSGFNRDVWTKRLEGITDEQFTKILKNPDFKLRLEVEEFDHEMKYSDVTRACNKIGAVYQERIYYPHTGRVSHHIYPSAPMIWTRLQQRAESEAFSASDTAKRNSVGQVTGESKGAQFSKPEIVASYATNRYDQPKEMMMVRSGSDHVKQQVYEEVINTGKATMNDKEIDLEGRSEVNKLRANYIGMNIKLEE